MLSADKHICVRNITWIIFLWLKLICILSISYMEWLKHHLSQFRVSPPLSPSLWPVCNTIYRVSMQQWGAFTSSLDCFKQFTWECAEMDIILSCSSVLAILLSLAHGLVGRRNLWLLVVPSMSYMIPMSWLSLFLPALSLQPILLHWSCTLLNFTEP